MALVKAIEEYESVHTWAKGLREQWGENVLAGDPQKLHHLAEFCGFLGKDPDALIAFCFLRRKATGERFGSVKRRQEMAEKLKGFRARSEGSPSQARRQQNDVLSFLIHNGVLIQMGIG